LSRDTAGVKIKLTIDARPLGRDAGLKHLRASSNAEKQTKFTNYEFKFEIRRRLSSRVNRPSRRRYFSSLRTRSNTRSTSSLAAWHQWLKFPISTQDFAILAWFSMEAKASARCSTQGFPRQLVEVIGNGSVELPSSQNISLAITAVAPPGRSKKCKKV